MSVSEHVVRYEVPDLVPGYGDQRVVADQAPRKRRLRIRYGTDRKELLQLLLNTVAVDQDATAGEGTGREPGVAGKDRPAPSERLAKDGVVVRGRVIENVDPEQAETLCQPAEHGVSDEPHIHSIPRGGG